MLPSDDVIREHAYLISRGVRPMSLVCAVEAESLAMKCLYEKLSGFAPINGGGQAVTPVPFVIVGLEEGLANGGFTTHSWIPETLQWLGQLNTSQKYVDRIIGLLLGYSPGAIAEYDTFRSGQLFHHGNEQNYPDPNRRLQSD